MAPPRLNPFKRLLRRLHGALANRAVILCYHRVADLQCNPFQTALSAQTFEQHLQAIRSVARPIALGQLVQHLREDRVPHRSVAVTFDDGYADLTETVLPLLKGYDVPATAYLISGAIDQRREFWWDTLERVFLQPHELPPTLDLDLNGTRYRRELGDAARSQIASWELDRQWLFDGSPSPTLRQQIVRDLHPLMGKLPPIAREHAADQLSQWSGIPPAARQTHRTLSSAQVVELAVCPLIEIGGHTVNHPMLPTLSADEQFKEIADDKAAIALRIGRPIQHFAYPYGWHANESIEAVKKAGYASASTLIPAPLVSRWDPYRLTRLWAKPWSGEELARQLKSWFANG